jgi:hypothetical protein
VGQIRSHIVPQSWLRLFARGERIAIRHRPDDRRTVANVTKALVEKDFYGRQRPDGTHSSDVEAAMSAIESRAPGVLREIEHRLPLTLNDKGLLAEFFALQAVRGPAWRDWHRTKVAEMVTEYRSTRVMQLPSGIVLPLQQRDIDAVESFYLGRTETLKQMLELIPKVATVMGCMHWVVLEFEDDLVATSDEPVVQWPLRSVVRRPGGPGLGIGVRSTLEIRVPISARRAVVMSWVDEADADAIVPVGPEAATNLNSFTRSQSRRQWVHHPDVAVEVSAEALPALSLQLHAGAYSSERAIRSQRRAHADELTTPMLGEPQTELAVLEVTAAARA